MTQRNNPQKNTAFSPDTVKIVQNAKYTDLVEVETGKTLISFEHNSLMAYYDNACVGMWVFKGKRVSKDSKTYHVKMGLLIPSHKKFKGIDFLTISTAYPDFDPSAHTPAFKALSAMVVFTQSDQFERLYHHFKDQPTRASLKCK